MIRTHARLQSPITQTKYRSQRTIWTSIQPTAWVAIMGCFLLLAGCASTGSGMSSVGEPGWRREIILQGDAKRINDATPIHERPYRPFHFYGNTVRRLHYRQTILPSTQDFRGWNEALQTP